MTFHETVPPVGTRCGDPRCGQSIGQGHPRTGWVRVFVAGSHDSAVWYSSTECLVFALGVRPGLTDEPFIWPKDRRRGFGVGESVRLLSRYSGYRLTTLSLTTVRIAYAYQAATRRLDTTDPAFNAVMTALVDARAVLMGWVGTDEDPATRVGDGVDEPSYG